MATNFPSSADNFTNPTSSDTLDSPDHAAQHTDVNDAVEALQAKVGVDSSAVTTSHDYKIAQLEGKSPTITLAGDAAGSVTLTNLGGGTLTVTVNDDSHNHTIANVDNLQSSLDGKAASSHTHPYAASSHTHSYVPTSGGTVTGNFTAQGNMYIGKNGGGDSFLYFYDDNSNAWRSIYWDDSENRFRSGHNIKFDGYVHSKNNFYVGDNGMGDSDIYFYDDNSNTWRTMRWDDSVNDWRVEDNGGTMRTLYHSGNIPSYLSTSGGTISGNLAVSGRFQIGGHYIDDVAGSGNPYGSINVGGAMSWDGYAIDQRLVFMHNGSTNGGIYDDAANEWSYYHTTNAQSEVRHNGTTRVQTESAGAYIAGRLRAYRNSSGSDTNSMQVEALSAASNNRTAGFTGHIPNYLAPVLRVWTGAGEGFDCGNYAGNAYAFLGASSFVTRSSERWKKNIRSRSDDEIIPTALALLSCRTARWDDINLEPVYCEEQMCLVQPDMCDDPNCECECCTTVKTNPIQDRHFNRRGYVVEELAEVFPDAIHYEEDGRPSGIDYSVLTAELIDIVKLLVLQCDTQEQRIAALEGAA